MTYFAMNPADVSGVVSRLHTVIEAAPDQSWMALVDGAFDAGQAPFDPWPDAELLVLHGEHGTHDPAAGPYLITLPAHDSARLRDALTAIVSHASGRPMLSILGSRFSPAELRAHWAPSMEVDSSDDQRFVLRFADTRVLPVLADPFLRDVWRALAAPVSQWYYIERSGSLGRLLLDPDADEAAPVASEGEAVLSEAGLEKLVSAGLPDAVIDIVAEQLPELIPEGGGEAFYDRVAALCRLGQEHGVDSLRDIVALVTIGLITEGALIKDPRLYAILAAKTYESGELMEHLVALLDE